MFDRALNRQDFRETFNCTRETLTQRLYAAIMNALQTINITI